MDKDQIFQEVIQNVHNIFGLAQIPFVLMAETSPNNLGIASNMNEEGIRVMCQDAIDGANAGNLDESKRIGTMEVQDGEVLPQA